MTRRAWRILVTAASCGGAVGAMGSGAAWGGVIYVRAGAAGTGDGSSWANAYPSLVQGIESAQTGDEVWVAAGTYKPGAAGASRDSTFALKVGVALYGGFAGTETLRGQRNVAANPTVLSGDLAGDDGPQFANRSDNVYHVVTALNVNTTAIIDGFVIQSGQADGPGQGAVPASRNQGSGLNVYFSTPLVRNCTFRDNYASDHGTINDHGGATVEDCLFIDNYAGDHGAGLYFHMDVAGVGRRCRFERNITGVKGGGGYSMSRTALYEDCVFVNNRADRGGGVYNHMDSATTIRNCRFEANDGLIGGGGVYVDDAETVITGCEFVGNRAGENVPGGSAGAGGSGGAGVWINGGNALVENSTFTGNQSSFGSGVYHNDDAVSTVRNCTFTGNHSREGAGVYALFSDVRVIDCLFQSNSVGPGDFPVGGGASVYVSTVELSGCTFIGNTAELGGGGVYLEGGQPRVYNCRFFQNAGIGGNDCCGSDGWGGGILIAYFTTPTIAGNVFVANRADQGGAIFSLSFAEPSLINCTFAGNRAREGGALYGFSNSNATGTGCIVVNNSVPENAGLVPAAFTRSIVTGASGVGNVHADPMFVRAPSPGADGQFGTQDDDLGDMCLRAGSPAIDAGDTTVIPAWLAVDAAGTARVRNDAGSPDSGVAGLGGAVVDIGAYEFQGNSCRADANGNGVIEPADIAVFVQRWLVGATAQSQDGDFDRSGVTDPADIAQFVQAWLSALAGPCP